MYIRLMQISKYYKAGVAIVEITIERISHDLRDLLVEYNLVDPVIYEFNELRSILIELAKGCGLCSHKL